MADKNQSAAYAPPSDARTIQWAPNASAGGAGKPGQGSIGACDACRARKVRCLASENTMSNKCQRCARAGRECVYTVHSKTRRRKRTDTRVKELEEKVKNLSVLLEQGKQGSGHAAGHKAKQASVDVDDDMDDESDEDSYDEDEDDQDEGLANPENDLIDETPAVGRARPPQRRQTSWKRSSPTPEPGVRESAGGGKEDKPRDVIDRGFLTMKEATELFDRYVNVLLPNYPSVVFAPGTTAAEVRQNRPILFLAVIAAAASTADPKLNLKLNKEILKVYATKVALEGQKNLDLIQSILISSLWYYPPERFDQLKFHQYIHMAATMALDLGLGKRPRNRRNNRPPKPAVIPDYEPQKLVGEKTLAMPQNAAPDSTALESRRTLLACYLQCASVSLSLRLPNALRFTSYMGECLEVLENSPDAAPTDKRFVAWIKIQRIIEDCVNAFGLDDPESTVSLEDIRIQNMLKGFEKQMEEFRRIIQPGVMNAFLDVNYHVNNIFMHEICLHPDHDPEDFRPPFYVATTLTSAIPTNRHPAYVNAVMQCVTSAQAIITRFLEMPLAIVRALPALIYVRTIYSCVVLIKLEVSTRAPSSELAGVLSYEMLAVPLYLQRILTHMVDIVGTDGRNIISAKFLLILRRLFEWYRTYRKSMEAGTQQEQPQAPFEPAKAMAQQQQRPPPQPQPRPNLNPNLDFNTLPPTSQPGNAPYHGFSNVQQQSAFSSAPPPPPPPPPLVFTASPPTSPQNQHPQPDYHASLLAHNAHSPSSGADDYSSPEYYPPNNNNNQGGGGTNSQTLTPEQPFIPTPDFAKMEVDPNIFGQLQDMERPFTFNPDPNDWMFDAEVMQGMGPLGNPGMMGGPMSGGGAGGGGLNQMGMSMGMGMGMGMGPVGGGMGYGWESGENLHAGRGAAGR